MAANFGPKIVLDTKSTSDQMPRMKIVDKLVTNSLLLFNKKTLKFKIDAI